ncbi:hypothetical protein DFH06DRAFT_435956 [Mycena polygramma]|nr:hypothetical protein DFH06DRAFT_435956 [Mycena polygramma]
MLHGAAPIDRDEQRSSIALSSLTHLLSTNNPPSDVEISLIRDSITDDSLRMNALNAQIDTLSALLARLIVERDGMADRLQKYSAVLSPVRRIPAELVCEIFLRTLPDQRSIDDDTADPAPWYLGHVSRTWRHIATGFPLLWRTVSVYHSEDLHHQPLAMLQAQLERSSGAPLDLNLGWWADRIDDALPLLDVLLPHSNRWDCLRLSCNAGPYAMLLPFFRPVEGQLAQLKRLEFNIGKYDHGSPRMSSDCFSVAPCLREVFLISPDFYEYSPTILLPWQQITHYRAFLPADEFFDIFRAASNLVEATLQTDDDIEEGVNDTVLALPHLRRLYVAYASLLTQITAPLLEYLSANTTRFILPFLHRSSCQLTTLVLASSTVDTEFTLPPEDVISLLRKTPTLRNLLLQASFEEDDDNNNDNNDQVLKAMTLSGSADDLCPNLLHLVYGPTMTADDDDPFSHDLFVAMIRSRLYPTRGRSLSSVKLFSPLGKQYCAAMNQMAAFIDDGFAVGFIDDWVTLLESAPGSFAFAR